MHSFLKIDTRVVLKRHCSNWSKIKAGVPKGLILVPLFLLVYIFYLPDEVTTNAKFFAYDASLFQLPMVLQYHQYRLTMFYLNFLNGLNDEKYHSTHMSQNKSKRLFFLVKQLKLTMQLYTLTTFW